MTAESSRCLVYLTAPDAETADRLANALVAERLAACVNVLGAIRSVYRWKGAVEQSGEVALLAKTVEASVDALTRRVKDLHPYECPCIVTLPICGGDPAFLDWIAQEVAR